MAYIKGNIYFLRQNLKIQEGVTKSSLWENMFFAIKKTILRKICKPDTFGTSLNVRKHVNTFILHYIHVHQLDIQHTDQNNYTSYYKSKSNIIFTGSKLLIIQI